MQNIFKGWYIGIIKKKFCVNTGRVVYNTLRWCCWLQHPLALSFHEDTCRYQQVITDQPSRSFPSRKSSLKQALGAGPCMELQRRPSQVIGWPAAVAWRLLCPTGVRLPAQSKVLPRATVPQGNRTNECVVLHTGRLRRHRIIIILCILSLLSGLPECQKASGLERTRNPVADEAL